MKNFLREDNFYEDYNLLCSNGGFRTFDDWLCENDIVKKDWYKALKNLDEYITYTNKDGLTIILTHAGFTPGYSRTVDIIWDRLHFNEPWDEEHCKNVIVIHGHTPIYFMIDEENPDLELEPGAYWYCNNHKVNIDNGTYYTGYTCLLDLDTFDEHIFYTEVEKE